MKKIRLFSVVAATLVSLFSFQANAAYSDFRAVSGVSFTHEDRSGTLTSNYPGVNLAALNDSGSGYGGLLGIRGTWNDKWLLGLEAYAESARIERPTSFTSTAGVGALNTTVAYKRATQWGLTGIAGRKWIPMVTSYVRLGVQQSKDRLAVTNVLAGPAFDYHEASATSTNIVLGAGAEIPLFSDKTAVRIEYDHVFADSNYSTDTTAPLTGADPTHTYGPQSKIIKLQWIWKLPVKL